MTNGVASLAESHLMLVSTGRGPVVEGLGLEAIGVDYDRRAGIRTDERRRTSIPHVTDLIEAGVVALDADGMAAHPTLSEAIKEAGLVALGRAIHLPPKRRAAAQA